MMLKYILLFCLLFNPLNADARDYDEDTPFKMFDDLSEILPNDDDVYHQPTKPLTAQQNVAAVILNEIKEDTANNIIKTEQVLCYHVTKKEPDYTGYTLDRFALVDYCGDLEPGPKATIIEALFKNSPNILTTKSDCRIEPHLMLRFIRGIDYTDVLISPAPCASLTIFYAGKHHIFNVRQEIIKEIIDMFKDKHIEFNSPALIKQTATTADITTSAQEDILKKKQPTDKPLHKWEQEEEEKNKVNEDEKKDSPKTGGWIKSNWRQRNN